MLRTPHPPWACMQRLETMRGPLMGTDELGCRHQPLPPPQGGHTKAVLCWGGKWASPSTAPCLHPYMRAGTSAWLGKAHSRGSCYRCEPSAPLFRSFAFCSCCHGPRARSALAPLLPTPRATFWLGRARLSPAQPDTGRQGTAGRL